MNPLDLYGPQFLVFYAVFAAGVCFAVWLARTRSENTGRATPVVDDPYRVAYLRGGKNEALRVATVSLIDRGILKADGSRVGPGDRPGELVRRPIERALVKRFSSPSEATVLYSDALLEAACEEYDRDLQRDGLLPDTEVRNRRMLTTGVAWMALVLVAAAKTLVALARGRHNVQLLIFGSAAACVIAYRIGHPRQTLRGARLLDDLKELCSGLRNSAPRIAPGGATNELALVAAVFGLAALPAGFTYVPTLFPKGSSASGGGASCGSSCGSSCGGGCGGGCGGCGG